MNQRAEALASRIEQGFEALVALAADLTDSEWQTFVPHEGRTVGTLIHHVASVYPIEIDLARELAAGKPIEGVTWDGIAQMNAGHAQENAQPDKQQTIMLLRRNGKLAADRVRAFSDTELDMAAPISLYANAPLTAQFFIEDHALRHSAHHLASICAALSR